MRYSHDSSIKMLTLDFQNTNDFMKKRNPSLYHVIISNPSFYILRLLKDYWKKIIKSIDTSLSIEKESLKNSHFHQQPPRLLKPPRKQTRIHARVKPISFLNVITAVPRGYTFHIHRQFSPLLPPLLSSYTLVISSRYDSRTPYLN